MANDFASLLSVFRDATSSSTSGGAVAVGRGPSNSSAVAQKTPQPQPSSSMDNSKTNNEIDPTSSKDPNFSAQLLKERIERILRIQQIRKSTATGTCAKNDTTTNERKSVHIAICATIVDEFPHEAIWRKWMDETGGECILDDDGSSSSGSSAPEIAKASSEESKNRRIMTTAEMYIHAKNPERIRSEWLR